MRIFSLLLIIFVVHQLAQYLNFKNDFLDAYLDPFLFFPLVMFVAVRWNQFYNKSYQVSWLLAVGSFVIMAILFELIFPLMDNRFDADVYDVIAYAAGIILFMVKLNNVR